MTSPTSEFLKGTLEACPYKGANAIAAASFQLAIVAVLSVLLGASGDSSTRSARSE